MKKPNFLVIVADDMGFSDAGCYGGELYDMESDRSELNNLAKKHPDRVVRMAALWDRCHRTFVGQSGGARD